MVSILFSAILMQQKTHIVEFSFASNVATKVAITGDFNAWSSPIPMKVVGSKWSKSFELPDNARIEYKFVVDDQWILDPSNPHRLANGIGGENSVWTGPKYKSLVHDQTPMTPLLRSEISVAGRTIILFSPAKSTGLPLLIYGDGPNYESIGRIQNIYENLVEEGKIRPAVIVLVPPIDRMKEYGTEWRAYGDYIFNKVLPAAREETGASERATDTYMGGSSMGGLISLRLAEEFPNKLAGGIHCQSGAIQWSALDLNFSEPKSIDSVRKISPHCRIWIDWGDFEEGLTSANVKLAATLKKFHRPFGSLTTPEGHTWTAWRNRMETGLTYLLGK